jgi:hypothetical protein
VLNPKHLNGQDQKDAETLTHKRDREAGSTFSIDNLGNNLNALNPKLTLKYLDEAKQTVGSHKGGPDDDATKKMMMWMN